MSWKVRTWTARHDPEGLGDAIGIAYLDEPPMILPAADWLPLLYGLAAALNQHLNTHDTCTSPCGNGCPHAWNRQTRDYAAATALTTGSINVHVNALPEIPE